MKKLLVCLFAITMVSCDVEEEIANILGDGTVRADVNGETKTFTFGQNSVAAAITSSNSGPNTIYAFGMGASTDGISDNSETTAIAVTLLMDNPDVIVAGASFSYPNDLLGGTYTFEDENGSTNIDGDESTSANLNITSVDIAGERISGTFSFVTIDSDTNTTYTVSNGSFTNIPFYIN
ncbi:hypothetical protein [Winogradskyella eximia]|uniref:hypothetical protein n=1 Tax=Winogradskyella eximia TaxID=262006 RepID=UPI0024923A9B|nr:hypothetical protein [Winogradskyella eximia]